MYRTSDLRMSKSAIFHACYLYLSVRCLKNYNSVTSKFVQGTPVQIQIKLLTQFRTFDLRMSQCCKFSCMLPVFIGTMSKTLKHCDL